ncbi:MAG: cysteine--tRNA ligase [Candidatus Terrybacteria bacterium]|nr:cysteine--tRNA ligase [Candidatus Terrybacteria bacterium]
MLKIYNTLTRKKEVFHPRRGNAVRMFVCGPTVYDLAHIGHGRTYVIFDVMARYLRFRALPLKYLMNITDLDDKIIARASLLRRSWKSVAREYERAFLKDLGRLGIRSVNRFARATDFIPEIAAQVTLLLQRGIAYRIEGDGIYFDLKKFPRYGLLAHRTATAAEDATSRIDDSVQKRNRGDFCLWKFSQRGEPMWKSRIGPGRPGWHIEDTAITHKVFGPQYDLHGGALDLIFPHHEAEIAQMEAAYRRKPMARFWMHSGFLNVRGGKMGKSKGNFITIRELLDKWPAEAFRVFALSAHYRSPIDYDTNLMAQASSSWERIVDFSDRIGVARTRSGITASQLKNASPIIKKAYRAFFRAMDDDLDTPKALAAVFGLIRKLNPVVEKKRLPANEHRAVAAFLYDVNTILGILPSKRPNPAIPKEILALAAQRDRLRRARRFTEADALRGLLQKRGWRIEDAARGSRLKREGNNTPRIPSGSPKGRLAKPRPPR